MVSLQEELYVGVSQFQLVTDIILVCAPSGTASGRNDSLSDPLERPHR